MNEYVLALIGGGLIGLSASIFLLFKGRIFGVSGIVAGLVVPKKSEFPWKLAVTIGLILGGWATLKVFPSLSPTIEGMDPIRVAIAGALVGFGTQLGGGCTSGHGVCGISRLSVRSILATVTFMTAGILTVYLTK